MAEQNQTDDHWHELAELLGLPAGEAAAKEQAPASPVNWEMPAPPASPDVEAERLSPRVTDEVRLEPMAEEAPPGWESEFDEGDDDTAIDESLLRDEPAGEAPADVGNEEFVEAGSEEPVAPAEGGTPVNEEDKPRRGRRRRRRGRKGGRDGDERPPQAGEPRRDEREPRGKSEPEQRDRGGRRRDEEPRHAGPPRREPVPIDADIDTSFKPTPPMEIADDTDFSNWNVPSWQDLIASLYRPDR
jgi:hypothetical protein